MHVPPVRAVHEVVVAHNGGEAVRLFGDDATIEALLLDIGLPDADGRDVCQALRSNGQLAPVMFLTALGLAWILGRQAGANGMAIALGAALLLALALWWIGARQIRGRAILPVLPLVAVAAAVVLTITPVSAAPATGGPLKAQPFSEAALQAARASGRPVFAYFTADWCLTCKVNEKAAIERQEVANAFARGDVAVKFGVWIRPICQPAPTTASRLRQFG